MWQNCLLQALEPIPLVWMRPGSGCCPQGQSSSPQPTGTGVTPRPLPPQPPALPIPAAAKGIARSTYSKGLLVLGNNFHIGTTTPQMVLVGILK